MKRIESLIVVFGLWCSITGAWAQCALGQTPYPYQYTPNGPVSWQCHSSPTQETASAAPAPAWADRWGAIATDSSHGALGGVAGMVSEQAAKQAALNDCKAKGGATCKIETTYMNGCTALTASNTDHFVGAKPTLEHVVSDGLQMCSAANLKNCNTVYRACSLPMRIQ